MTYAGTLDHINGVDYLVEIAAVMRDLDPSVRFLLVGDGAQRESIAEKGRDMDVLGRNLWMEERVAKREMSDILAATDLPILTCPAC